MPILECNQLSKSYGKVPALDGVSFAIEPGRIVGLLGPNGSGKTTLIKLANGLLTPSSGEILIDGRTPGRETHAMVSYLPERTAIPTWMSAGQLMDFYEDFYPDFRRQAAEEMLHHLNIQPKQRIKQMSKGTREKVQLIMVMSRAARLYLLDEPIGGVDPATRDYILSTIISNYNPDAAVVISTHLIADVEKVLDEVVFIDRGHLVLQSSVDQIREEKGMSVDALFRATGRIMLPLFGILLLVSVGANFSSRGMLNSDSSLLRTLGTIFIMLFIVGIFAVGIISFVLMINRFYKNLLQDEGYVMMTLPVCVHQQIWSKLIVSTVWFAATVVVIGLSCCIMAFDIRFVGDLWHGFLNLLDYAVRINHLDLVANGAAFAVELLLLCVLGSFDLCLRFYSAMSIGFSFPNHKGLLSVAFYIATGIALQILDGLGMALVNDSWFHRLLLGWEPNVSVVAGMHLGMWFLIVLELIYCAVFYFLTVYFLQKHLNLE